MDQTKSISYVRGHVQLLEEWMGVDVRQLIVYLIVKLWNTSLASVSFCERVVLVGSGGVVLKVVSKV